MTLQDCTAILAPLALAMRADLDEPTFRAYYRALEDVPVQLLEAAVTATMREPRDFFPKAGELRGLCELTRRRLLARHPWTPCIECENSPRWREVQFPDGVRVEKCPCVARHQASLKDSGLLEPVSALPGEAGAGDEAVYPTLAQLPAPLQPQLRDVTRQKAMR